MITFPRPFVNKSQRKSKFAHCSHFRHTYRAFKYEKSVLQNRVLGVQNSKISPRGPTMVGRGVCSRKSCDFHSGGRSGAVIRSVTPKSKDERGMSRGDEAIRDLQCCKLRLNPNWMNARDVRPWSSTHPHAQEFSRGTRSLKQL